ncbi:4'-phosphopantetheinyl transferase superfamily protein [Streptomyces sp. CC210A]|uniref:4'-phosphopantetheinyl transferase family protein n=1 Tax=Streptomyces sp. CC210A TaxID=2898184 RepID=UPI001F437221|nr:hypothetical protein [Streptomyces sp. CC210A]
MTSTGTAAPAAATVAGTAGAETAVPDAVDAEAALTSLAATPDEATGTPATVWATARAEAAAAADPVAEAAVAAVATTTEVLSRPDLTADMLAPWELHRLARIRIPARRDDVLASRLLLRLCVARCTGRPPGATVLAQHCADCDRYGHGRPYLPGLPAVRVSLSHADGVVAAAAGPGPLGIDIEPRTRRPGPLPVLRRLLPDADRHDGEDLLRAWVRREALVKAGRADGDRAGLHLREWTDPARAAVAALASQDPCPVLTTV